MQARAIALAVTSVVSFCGCGRGPLPPDIDGIDPEVYARGYCFQQCYRFDECGIEPESTVEQCADVCEQDELGRLGEPCWVERVEVQRCVVRLLECNEIDLEDPDVGPGSPCREYGELLESC